MKGCARSLAGEPRSETSSKNKGERRRWRRRRPRSAVLVTERLELASQSSRKPLGWPERGGSIQITIYRDFVESGWERERMGTGTSSEILAEIQGGGDGNHNTSTTSR